MTTKRYMKKRKCMKQIGAGNRAKALTVRNIPQPVIGELMPFSSKSFLYRREALLRLSPVPSANILQIFTILYIPKPDVRVNVGE
jgi:hypothetical protein